MKEFCWKFSGLWTGAVWMEPAFVLLKSDGTLVSVTDEAPQRQVEVVEERGWAIPGFQNAHSHAFQYAMAGQTECQALNSGTSDDFWSWRELMYKLALAMNPDQFEAIMAYAYAEMLRFGFTHVAEFHYIHHDPTGAHYANTAEMSERVMRAAQTAGIGLTLVPIFYKQAGFGQPARNDQRRFISKNSDAFLELMSTVKSAAKTFPNVRVGTGIHSLRAVDVDSIKETLKATPRGTPVHIHAAEQPKEIADCLTHIKKRPVEWLLDNLSLGSDLNVVHATHITADETARLAKSQATVVLCPTTEANLGDGIFPLVAFQKAGGRFAIGTDSNIGLDPAQELRLLDYGQRLILGKRNPVAAAAGHVESGDALVRECHLRGLRSMGEPSGEIFGRGQMFQALILNSEHPTLALSPASKRMSAYVYATGSDAATGTVVGTKKVVKSGLHQHRERLGQEYLQAMRALGTRL